MEATDNIVIIDNDQYLLALLSGYCYANNITISTLDFGIHEINELEILKPKLVILPFDWVQDANKFHEVCLLRRLSGNNQIKICILIKNPTEFIPPVLSEWVDVFISNPFDIGEIDRYLKSINLLNNSFKEKRTCRDRRLTVDRRSIKPRARGKNGDKENRNSGFLSQIEKPELKDFKIDFSNKCLFIKAQRIDLSPKEYELIELLSTDVNRIFTSDEIINRLWPKSNRATKSDLYQYMYLLRKKIETDPNDPQWILNIKGFGYKLNTGKSGQLAQSSLPYESVTALPGKYIPVNHLAYQ